MTRPVRSIVVTGADEGYATWLRQLVGSLQQWEPSPFTAIGCLDVGLAPATRRWLDRQVTHVVEPGWDLDVAPAWRTERPHLRALTARPFLPRHFPGYDVYLWIDADAWVQERFAIEWFTLIAAQGALGAVPEADRAYLIGPKHLEWRRSRFEACFGAQALELGEWSPYFNAGVYSLGAAAPHWAAWGEQFRRALAATDGFGCCDQTALNWALRTSRLAAHPLPATFNWMCHYAWPVIDPHSAKVVEPIAPANPIGIVHLTEHSKHAPQAAALRPK